MIMMFLMIFILIMIMMMIVMKKNKIGCFAEFYDDNKVKVFYETNIIAMMNFYFVGIFLIFLSLL